MTEFPRITRNPAIMSGRACLRDTHVTASTIVTLLAAGHSKDEILRMLPVLTPEDLQAALAYAAWWIDEQGAPCAVPAPPPLPEAVAETPAEALPEILSEPITEEVIEPLLTEPELSADSTEPETASEESPEIDESLELFHPSHPDQPTVIVTRHGLFDRRWGTHTIAWSDIREIQRVSGRKTINVILRNPEYYIASMPFFRQICAQVKLAFNIQTLYLDTASLGIRTKDVYLTANRLWMRHRGLVMFRKKRRVRVNGSSSTARKNVAWERYQPM